MNNIYECVKRLLSTCDKQINSVTSFGDLDIIYGLDESILESLRSTCGPFFRTDGGLMPGTECNSKRCKNFFAGDNRSNQTTSLLILHAMFIQLHNKLSLGLMKVNPHWDDEKTFSETRELVISIFQSITYNYWLTAYLGRSIEILHKLR